MFPYTFDPFLIWYSWLVFYYCCCCWGFLVVLWLLYLLFCCLLYCTDPVWWMFDWPTNGELPYTLLLLLLTGWLGDMGLLLELLGLAFTAACPPWVL